MSETMTQPLTVCVEGNIGSGKTTFLKYFKKYPQVAVFDEPISKWRDCQGYNLLVRVIPMKKIGTGSMKGHEFVILQTANNSCFIFLVYLSVRIIKKLGILFCF